MLGPDADLGRRCTTRRPARLRARTRRLSAAMPPPLSERQREIASRRRLRRRDGEKIHRRRADEGGDELVVRPGVELQRRADLRDDAAVEHDDAVGQRHRLDLVVGDVDHRGRRASCAAWPARCASARAASRRGWIAARRTGRPPARAPARGRWRRAGAGRRKAAPACGPSDGRAAAALRPRRRASSAPRAAHRRPTARTRCSGAPSDAGRAHRTGTPWRCGAWPGASW